MTYKVVRLGGSQVYHASSIRNLIHYLDQYDGSRIVVFSAVPEIMEVIQKVVEEVFTIDVSGVEAKLSSLFTTLAGSDPSSRFADLLEQLTGILRGISLTGDYSEALKGQVLSFGEKLTGEIFREIFGRHGRKVSVVWPEDVNLQVTAEFGNATFRSLDKTKWEGVKSEFFLFPGSYGITENGKIARAGIAAADYTAAFITKLLGLEKLELWGMDDGFFQADPSIVADSQSLTRLTYSEASELAYFDHISFHPRTVEPLEAEHIPVCIVNTDLATGKTETVINTETYVESQIVKSIACTDDISMLRLNGPGVGLKPGILARVTSLLNEGGINIRSVITSQISIHLILDRKSGIRAHTLIRQLGFSTVQDITLIEDVSLVGIVGHGMQQNYGVSARIFAAVASEKINVLLSGSGASDLVSYLIVHSSDKEKSVREIYRAFFGSEKD